MCVSMHADRQLMVKAIAKPCKNYNQLLIVSLDIGLVSWGLFIPQKAAPVQRLEVLHGTAHSIIQKHFARSQVTALLKSGSQQRAILLQCNFNYTTLLGPEVVFLEKTFWTALENVCTFKMLRRYLFSEV